MAALYRYQGGSGGSTEAANGKDSAHKEILHLAYFSLIWYIPAQSLN